MVVAVLASCSGPAASDGALCHDLITRLCLGTRCPVVDTQLNPGDACVQALEANTGCAIGALDDYQFTTPSRDRVLECRIPLLRQGDSISAHPDCADVDEMFTSCPDVVKFLGGTQ